MKFLTDALQRGTDLGVDYIDVRVVEEEAERLRIHNGEIRLPSQKERTGVAVRLLTNGVWGYATTNRLDAESVLAAVDAAYELAGTVPGFRREVSLSPMQAVTARYETPVTRDPFSVPMLEKLELLSEASRRLLDMPGIKSSDANARFSRNRIRFVSSEGADISQVITWGGGGLTAVAEGNGRVQKRTYPYNAEGGTGWNFQTGGWEVVEDMDLPGNVVRMGTEAVELLSAPPCPSKVTTVILTHSVLAIQVHESIGHPIEMDRVLGDELANFGGSFVPLDRIGSFRYGSDIVSVNADATSPRGAGSFGFDDEGVPAQCTPIIRNGILVNILTSRETAPLLGKSSNGTMRALGTGNFPIIRMTNINLLPGDSSIKQMIAETDDGILFDTFSSYDIDDMRVNFTFAAEIGWQIKNGRIVGMFCNPSYTSNSMRLWNNCDAIAGPDEWKMYGVDECGKGQPWQFIRVGHGVSAARFQGITVGA